MFYLTIFAGLLALASAASLHGLSTYMDSDSPKVMFPEQARGRTSSRIIAGQEAKLGQFPHQARIIIYKGLLSRSICGGAIISETVVFTAAHCTYRSLLFDLGFGSINSDSPAVSMKTMRKVEHQDYDPSNLNNDVSLLILPRKLSFNSNIKAIKLPSLSQQDETFEHAKATVSGHGKTADDGQVSKRLMFTNVEVISNDECVEYYNSDIIRDFTLCAIGFDNDRQSTCNGDSGGPLITDDEESGEKIHIGVVSFVSGRGCEAGYPFGFVRTTSYLNWIHGNSGIEIE
ncbi:collagenase-like [Culicoides brevitarsis]|uniref:collagenase-like n=1 Tax=Culicoides brevitarsis TaxID=469753 RepID=UPI00307C07BB